MGEIVGGLLDRTAGEVFGNRDASSSFASVGIQYVLSLLDKSMSSTSDTLMATVQHSEQR